jgi:hypothetical protein
MIGAAPPKAAADAAGLDDHEDVDRQPFTSTAYGYQKVHPAGRSNIGLHYGRPRRSLLATSPRRSEPPHRAACSTVWRTKRHETLSLKIS